MKEPFTSVPNRLIRSLKVSAYDKVVFIVIQSFNPSWPSYEQIMKYTGLSRERVWKSLRSLETAGLIHRYRKGRRIIYYTFTTSSRDELLEDQPVRYTNYNSSSGEL